MRKVLNILAIATVVVAGGVSLASAQEPLDIRGPYCSMKNPAGTGANCCYVINGVVACYEPPQ